MLQIDRRVSQRIISSWQINKKRRIPTQAINEMRIAIERINIEGKNLSKISRAKMREEAIGINIIIIVKTTLSIVITNQEIDMIERTVVKGKMIIALESSTPALLVVIKTKDRKSMKNMVEIIITETSITTIAMTIQIQFKNINQEEEDHPH